MQNIPIRLTKLRQKLTQQGLDAILITNPANRRYLSGFTGEGGILLISRDRAVLATSFTYYEQVSKEAPQFEQAKITAKFTDLMPDLVSDLGVRRLGLECDSLAVDSYLQMTEELSPGVELVPTSGIVQELRAVKDDQELASLRRAIALSDAAYTHIAEFMQPGMTERQVAWELESFMRTHGAEKIAFDIIVAAGPSGAMPHASPRDRAIRLGEPVVMDLGAVIDGYHSDLSRTVAMGRASDKYLKAYETVLQAQKAALEGIRPGMTGKQVDAIARKVIEKAGYDLDTYLGLGHGVGLVIHESPRMSLTLAENVVKPGIVFTVEPGIYLSGEFGVRIEDTAVLHEDGVEILSQAAQEPILTRA